MEEKYECKLCGISFEKIDRENIDFYNYSCYNGKSVSCRHREIHNSDHFLITTRRWINCILCSFRSFAIEGKRTVLIYLNEDRKKKNDIRKYS